MKREHRQALDRIYDILDAILDDIPLAEREHGTGKAIAEAFRQLTMAIIRADRDRMAETILARYAREIRKA